MTVQQQDALVEHIHLGAEFFLNRTETRESIARHFAGMRASGLSVVRIFLIWNDLEPTPGNWAFERYDWIYEAAAREGLGIAATLCCEDPPNWVRATPFYHHHVDLNDPAHLERAEQYIQRVVQRYHDHPAHAVWLLMNEPHPMFHFTPATMRSFGVWLQQRYGSIAVLNQRWFRQFARFEEVEVQPDQWDSFWCDYPSFLDWHEFQLDNLRAQLLWIRDQVRTLDTRHPTHINPVTSIGSWKVADVVDFLGASIHPAWSFSEVSRDEFGMIYAYFCDLIRSASKQRPWWVTELQGGSTVFTGARPLNPTPAETTAWLWDAIGAGAKGIIYWLWHPRSEGREGGEWGLVSHNGQPSDRLAAVKGVADVLAQVSPFLDTAYPQQAKVALLYNRQTLFLNELDGRLAPWVIPTKEQQDRIREATLAIIGCYRALHRLHIPVDFLDIDELKAGKAGDYAVLYTPYCYGLDDGATRALRQYVAEGGTLWADGLLGWKDADGHLRASTPGDLVDVFGCEVITIQPEWEPFSLTGHDTQAGALWTLPLRLFGAEPTLLTPTGAPVGTRHRYGKGEAFYVGTALTLGYFRHPEQMSQEWIGAMARERGWDVPVRLVKGSHQIAFRGITQAMGQGAILCNWGTQDEEAVVQFQGLWTSVQEITHASPVEIRHDNTTTMGTVIVKAGATVVLLAQQDSAR